MSNKLSVPTIVAVFVNYNDGGNIIRSSKDLLAMREVVKVIIVDNGSTDQSLGHIKKFRTGRKKLTILENNENLGFGKAANKGVKAALIAGGDYIAILNPDLVFPKKFIPRMLKNDADLLQFALRYKVDGNWVYDWGGKVNWIFGTIRHLESLTATKPDKNFIPDYVSGGACLIKREVFERIGFFDERFFMYYEDADFSIRARKAGFKILVDTNVIIEHKLEIVKRSKNWNKIRHNLASQFKFIAKHISWYFKPIAYTYFFLLCAKVAYNLTLGPLLSPPPSPQFES